MDRVTSAIVAKNRRDTISRVFPALFRENRMKRTLLFLSLGLMAFGTLGCGGKKPLSGGGSTFVYPMMSKWAAEFEKAKKTKVNYQSIGSGGGIAQMIAKTFDFCCTEAPMNEEQSGRA